MNSDRFQTVFQGQTTIAKKVFEAIPINEEWTKTQILQELRRLRYAIDPAIAMGCISTLVKSGIVREVKSGCFCRVKVREKTVRADIPAKDGWLDEAIAKSGEVKKVDCEEKKELPMKSEQPANDVISTLDSIAQKIKSIAKQFSSIAAEIETVAIEVDERIKADGEEAAKLKQLQRLLKELS